MKKTLTRTVFGMGLPTCRNLALALFISVTASGCGHPVQGSILKPAPLLRAELVRKPARGPLHIDQANSRYFADDAGRPVYLTGSHTWNNFQDWGSGDPPPAFNYQEYLSFLGQHGHNFFRLYMWEQAAGVPWSSEKITFSPMPYQRPGPGIANDGRPRFDLRAWNPEYFDRLRNRVQEAGDRGIYVSVMLFNGWSVDGKRSAMPEKVKKLGLGDPWPDHPFNRGNNINGIDGGGWGKVHTLEDQQVTELQKAYVRKVIDTVGDLDNVLWEISNESDATSTEWEYAMIRFIHEYESTRSKQHPVGMTAEFPDGKNADLWQSPADWISPSSPVHESYATDPPAGQGGKVVVADTDHIWGIGGSEDWVWKSFTRGLNPIFMDPYQADLVSVYPMIRNHNPADPTRADRERVWNAIRANLGYTRAYAERMNLSSMQPHGELASSHYCLASPGSEYLVYLPAPTELQEWASRELPATLFKGDVSVDLAAVRGDVKFEWFQPSTGVTLAAGTVQGGSKLEFDRPVQDGGLVLYLRRNE